MNEVEKAYLAGFLDGEGSISMRKKLTKRGWVNWQLTVSISNTSLAVMKFIRDLIQKEGVETEMYHIYQGVLYTKNECKEKKRVYYVLRWTSQKASKVLSIILSYLVVKRKQAELAIQFQKLMSKHYCSTGIPTWNTVQRETLIQQCKALNRGLEE